MACLQLCMEGYYDGCVFHRIIKGFMAQTGDPTNTGNGGESVFGKPFADEFHSRLRFTRRGLVAMANDGPNDNRSQFFVTFDKAEHLSRKHTLFGKVTGDTAFNLRSLEDMEVDKNDRPLYPPRIKSAEILNNPFDDIIPREKSGAQGGADTTGKGAKGGKKEKSTK